jgi:Photosynthetic reaction centre cytochrome C subunit
MRRMLITVTAGVFLAAASLTFIRQVRAQPPGGEPGGPPPGQPGGRPPGMMAMPPDSFASERDSLMNDLLDHYKDKLNEPAENVFKNIKMMKGRTVDQLLHAMNLGFGRALGTRCNHCHVLGHWADEDKNTKQIARDMMTMTGKINDELLPAIKNIKSEHPGVNCGTCHHGITRPGFGPMSRGGPGGPPGGGPGGH